MMDVTVYSYATGDPVLIDRIVNEFLSQGKFDKLRKECMADADTKPAYQNLQQRVESTVSQFLQKQIWKPDLNKNQLRDSLRKHILESGFLDAGINRIVDQIVNPSVLGTVFMPEVEEVVYNYLSIPRPGDKCPKQTEHSNKISGNTNSKQSEMTPLDSYKDHKIHKLEETSPVSDDFTIETSELDCSGTPDILPPLVPGEEDMIIENGPKEMHEIKREEDNILIDGTGNCGVKEEERPDLISQDAVCSTSKMVVDKMELPSDESQESFSRMGVERLRISESDGVNAPDSDASIPLEINEKSRSGSRDSDDFIMNKMSPISQGRLTPEITSTVEEEKKPLTFIGRIPKLKRDDSESSKSSKKEEKGEKALVKGVYSSDESDSSKQSLGKSDSEDKKLKEEKPKVDEPRDKNEKKYKESDDKKRRSDHHRSHSKDGKTKDDKSRSSREEKDRSHSRSRDDKSREKDRKSSSHSRSKSSSHHRSVHKHDRDHHRGDSRSRDKDRSHHDKKEKDKKDAEKKKREDEKRKKSKSVDDHGKERYKRDDRRSTDRDSNERDRTKDNGSNRMQSDGKKREKEQKVDDSKKERSQKEESSEKEGAVKEETETSPLEHGNEPVVQGEATSEPPVLNSAAVPQEVPTNSEEVNTQKYLDLKTLAEKGALTVVKFPKVVDDFYVKFNSTGFQYFEDWEMKKLDCEEEFKEFIDEAAKDLSLLSDEGSDYESYCDHEKAEARRQEVVSNSLLGFTNFEDGLIFDPETCEFYKWTNRKFYEEYTKKKGGNPGEMDMFSGSAETAGEYETGEKDKENRGRGKKVRKSLKILCRYQRKIGLKFKYGKEQHRFVRRRKKRYWATDTNGLKMRGWNNGNPDRGEDCSESVLKEDSDYREIPTALLLDSPAEEVMQDFRNLENYGESSGDTSVDDLMFEDEKDGETSFGRCKTDESSNHSSASVPKMDVEAKIRLYQIQALRRNKKNLSPEKTCILARIPSGSRADNLSEEGSDNLNSSDLAISNLNKKIKKRRIRIGLPKAGIKRDVDLAVKNADIHKKYNLPLSPESDDSTLNNNGVVSEKKNPRKRTGDECATPAPAEIPAKKLKEKRVIHQKYDSQDLYKPRPFSIGSKSRGRVVKAEEK